ncbi:hypothetical protein IAU60_006457 [Kwoniella sp. DSM 27419]
MDAQWALDGFVGTPDQFPCQTADYLQVVPPTPAPANLPSDFLQFLQDPPQADLRPSTSNMSLRDTRSSSASSYLSETWSTFGSDSPSVFDTSNSDEDGLDQSTTCVRSISPALLLRPALGRDLHVDPRLFAPRSRERDLDEIDTARPASAKAKTHPSTAVSTSAGPAGKPTDKKKRKSGAGSSPAGKKVSHARKQNPNHIPRPRNAFILFRKHVVDSKLIPPSVEVRHQNVSIITAKMWSEAPAEQKAHFNELARIEKEEHMKKYPGYRYQPVYRRTDVIRRRVRKDEAEEEKCNNVAELLIKGKTGETLEREIKGKVQRGRETPNEQVTSDASRRSSAACELSKGSLRAMRAQVRRQASQGSEGWSDSSRAGSVAGSRSSSERRSASNHTSRSTSRSSSPVSTSGDPQARLDAFGRYASALLQTQAFELDHPGTEALADLQHESWSPKADMNGLPSFELGAPFAPVSILEEPYTYPSGATDPFSFSVQGCNGGETAASLPHPLYYPQPQVDFAIPSDLITSGKMLAGSQPLLDQLEGPLHMHLQDDDAGLFSLLMQSQLQVDHKRVQTLDERTLPHGGHVPITQGGVPYEGLFDEDLMMDFEAAPAQTDGTGWDGALYSCSS